jgi:uncharacterized protein YbjQ (UPF0145 family)
MSTQSADSLDFVGFREQGDRQLHVWVRLMKRRVRFERHLTGCCLTMLRWTCARCAMLSRLRLCCPLAWSVFLSYRANRRWTRWYSNTSEASKMILSNTQEIPGKTIVEFFGVVSGSTVRAKHIGKDIMAGLKNVVGGELTGYTELLTEARGEAIRRMSHQAQDMGANAIVNVRFATSSVAQGAAELFAYGTAVTVE